MTTKTTSSSSSGGIGFVGVLTIVFITLKLTGNIAWSWWWVLAPIWLVPCFILLAMGLYFIVLLIGEMVKR